jgi:hypothetical protein
MFAGQTNLIVAVQQISKKAVSFSESGFFPFRAYFGLKLARILLKYLI